MDVERYIATGILSSLLLFGLVDVFLNLKYGVDGTISMCIYKLACNYPIVPFIFGVLAGHAFWPLISK